ncbi:MAG: tRNA pseudouridine(13) synthase TruD [Spirochaetales bacterium]|nr:tRNA pseudouridine(13) synthase TruD [Spirochaetales bacterium]
MTDFLVGEELDLPFLHSLPRVGGRIKGSPLDFVVRELPLYEPCGSGDHVYVLLSYKEENTQDVARRLQRFFDLRGDGVGYAGLKDRHSVCEQYFSLYLPGMQTDEVERRLSEFLPENPGMELKRISRHTNRLRRGHLSGNFFNIRLLDLDFPADRALVMAQAIQEELKTCGYANYFGLQRFGSRGDNASRGYAHLKGEIRPQRHLVDLLESALQSFVFNQWLSRRVQDGLFLQLLPGDVMRKVSSGGLFLAQDLLLEQPRFDQREICYTGPLPGRKMKQPAEEALVRERELLLSLGLVDARWRSDGARREARVHLMDLLIRQEEHALQFSFSLPPGSYATVVLREFTGKDYR